MFENLIIMDENIIIVAILLIIVVVIIVIVVIAALSTKRKLNKEESVANGCVPREETQRVEASQFREIKQGSTLSNSHKDKVGVYSILLYYVNIDGVTYGPFSLDQLKTYPLLEDTLITTNTLNGTWYEAKYFECLDDLFMSNEILPFTIDTDGTIVRLEQNGIPN